MNNTFPQIHLVYNRYKKASSTQKAVVEIRVTHNYQQKYISTGIWLYPNQWKDGLIVNCDDIVQISQTLDRLVSNVKQVLLEMLDEGCVDLRLLQERLNRKELEKITFIDFCKQRASIRMYGKKKDTQDRYERFLRLFSEWGKIKTFSSVTDNAIISYDKFLAGKGMKAYSKWQNYHRFLNSFIMDAIDEGLLKRNPYKWVNIERDKKSRGIERCLSPEEFRKLREAKMPTECLERVRDLFVFQVYTCLSYSDLKVFDSSKIASMKEVNIYTGKRNKTGAAFTIPLLQPAMDILDKYKGFLPVISNVKYNEYLKVVAQAAGLEKPISSHWARHTGATLLLNEGVPMQIVSKICGHSSTKITEQVYAKLLDETVVDAIQNLDI